MTTSAAQVHRLLRAGGYTLATAESLTGGRLAGHLTDVPGASRTYLGGAVTYASELKQSLLGVPREVVDQSGVVSAACARAMAEGVRALTGASYAVSTTGVAGPDEQEGKTPGTVYVGVAGPGLSGALRLDLSGDRTAVREQTCEHALATLAAILSGEETALG